MYSLFEMNLDFMVWCLDTENILSENTDSGVYIHCVSYGNIQLK